MEVQSTRTSTNGNTWCDFVVIFKYHLFNLATNSNEHRWIGDIYTFQIDP